MIFHTRRNNLRNLKICDLSSEKHCNSTLVCRIKHSRKRTAFSPGFIRKLQSVKRLHIRLLKSNLRKCGKIKTISRKIPSLRIIKRILDRQFHVRCSKLSDHRTVLIFYHRMNNALRLYDNLDLIDRNVKKPFGFYHFKTFIHHCRRIDRNLLSHLPVWMFQSIFNLYTGKFFSFFPAERSARSSQ